jgi:hypothetical protein
MKKFYTTVIFLLIYFMSTAQTAITAVTTGTSTAASTNTYANGGNTYNWGISPNNTIVSLNGFTAGGFSYTYAAFLNGTVKLRRVNNAGTSGNYTLIWAEATGSAPTFNMFPEYQNEMELFFDNRVYNKGTDNFFDNTSANSNNIERLDWIISSGFNNSQPTKVGFAVFERGATAAHDPFCIAAVTAVDGSGNPTAYSNTIVRVVAGGYGDPGPNVTYRILKAAYPTDLLDAGSNTQNRGGVIISLANLGIAANQTIYGYSLFANDLPGGATGADLVDYTNATFFPTNTGGPGGIDMIAITGVYIENTILPFKLYDFAGDEDNGNVSLYWKAADESSISHYEAERSYDARQFEKISTVNVKPGGAASNAYTAADVLNTLIATKAWYRIKSIDVNGRATYSGAILINAGKNNETLTVYPNPVKNDLVAAIYAPAVGKATVTVNGLSGAQLITKDIVLQKGNNAITVDEVNKLPAGLYQLIIRKEGGAMLGRQFVKQP